ncbi:hypothetical protein [Streptomyces sp. NPDC093094]|uniref:hypothetical protein n=1 Tax=Streptomyces sp. NPDC093094 TaxID=3366026 RepID=UPI00382E4208
MEFTRSLRSTVPDRSYGVMSDEQARRYGYHMAPDLDPRVPANSRKDTDLVASEEPGTAEDRQVRNLLLYGIGSDRVTEDDVRRGEGTQPPREAEVIGEYRDRPVREGGCYEEARSTVIGDGGSERNPVAMDIYISAFREAERDPEVREVVRKWSACMAREGHAYDSPLEAGTDLPTAQAPAADGREKEVARTDMACKHDTGLIRVWSAAEARHERTAMARHKDDIAAETARKKRMVANALRIIGATEGAGR